MPEPKTILFVSEYAGFYGGIEQYVRQTARALRQAGYRVELLYRARAKQAEEYLAAFDAHGTAAEGLSPAPLLVLQHRLWDASLAEELLHRHGQRLALVVHDHEIYCPRRYYYTPFGRTNCSRAYSFLRCGLCGLAVAPRHWQGGLRGMLARKFTGFRRLFQCARRMPHVIVLSEFMRDNLLRNGFSASQTRILPPIVSLPTEVPLPSKEHFKASLPCVGFAGQLLRGKGADLFLEVVRLLRRRGRRFRAILAGEGPDRPALEREVAARQLDVELHGFVADMPSWYPQCDFLLLPFRWQEPFGLVGAEAAANAVPVIAPALGGVRSWMLPERTGLLVRAWDAQAFAFAAETLLDSPELCARLGRAARDFAQESFSTQRFLHSFAEMIASCR